MLATTKSKILGKVVDDVIGERGELLRSVGSRGDGAHRGEGVVGLRSSEREVPGKRFESETEKFSF